MVQKKVLVFMPKEKKKKGELILRDFCPSLPAIHQQGIDIAFERFMLKICQ
jgi:hypothetical protein